MPPRGTADGSDVQREVVRDTRPLVQVDLRMGLETVIAIGATSYLLETASALRRERDPELAAEASAAIRPLREPSATDETPFDRPAPVPERQPAEAQRQRVVLGPAASHERTKMTSEVSNNDWNTVAPG